MTTVKLESITTTNENVIMIRANEYIFHVPKLFENKFEKYNDFIIDIKTIYQKESINSLFFLQCYGIVMENNDKHLIVSVQGLIFEKIYKKDIKKENYLIDDHVIISFYDISPV